MSKIKAALITLMLGSSSAAMASPSLSFSANAQVSFGTSVSAPIVRDHRSEPAPPPAAYPMPVNQWTSWISLGAPLSLSDGRDVVRPSLANMNITQLRLQATVGMSYVQKVQIRFKDGTLQNLTLNKWLTTKAPMINLDLQANHRGIDSITVLGTAAARNASYQLFAQGSRTVELPHPAQPPMINLNGVYSSTYGNVTLTQTGNRIHGTYPAKNGILDGTIENGVVHFRWTQPDGSGEGTFQLTTPGHLEGTFGYGANAFNGGEWDLTRR